MITSAQEMRNGGYLITREGSPGKLHVPPDPQNRHYIEVQEWIAEGNAPDPAPSDQPERDRRARRRALIANMSGPANPNALRDKINDLCAYLRGDD